MTAEIARRITCVLLVLVLAPAGEMFGRAAIQTKVRPTVAFAPATVQIEVLIEADMSHQIDNMEGLEVIERPDGEIRVILVSDDNHSILERNLMLEFRLIK